jgi:DNA-directed RNA polymerase sigma subunit (sigma70/sigma32)
MSQPTAELRELPESERREIFLALVEAQDRDPSVAKSREEISERFNITANQVRQIESEGVDNSWPPLD